MGHSFTLYSLPIRRLFPKQLRFNSTRVHLAASASQLGPLELHRPTRPQQQQQQQQAQLELNSLSTGELALLSDLLFSLSCSLLLDNDMGPSTSGLARPTFNSSPLSSCATSPFGHNGSSSGNYEEDLDESGPPSSEYVPLISATHSELPPRLAARSDSQQAPRWTTSTSTSTLELVLQTLLIKIWTNQQKKVGPFPP